jgi:beta-lactamase regulating signal transducer with metallopeptidase domain
MNGLSLIASLALFHATVVAIATLVVRFCIPRQHTTARAAVSSVGMACILFVSVFALLPLPSIWPHSESGAVPSIAGTIDSISKAERLNNVSPVVDATHKTSSANPPVAVEVSTAWLRQMSAGLNRTIDAASTTTSSWPAYLAVILLGGTAIGVFRIGLALSHVRRLHRTSIPVTDQTISKLLSELKHRCNCRREIQLRECSELASAATFGLRKPVILLSANWRQWSGDELAAVLAHELAHIHRADYLHRLLAELTAAIHFCHPLVRAAARRLRADQEFAADRLASSLSASREAYLRGFAELALRFHDSFQGDERWSNVSIMPRSSDFLVRRLHMLRTKDGSIDKRRSRIVSACAVLGIVVVALATTLLRSSSGLAAKPDSSATNSEFSEAVAFAFRENPNDEQAESTPKAGKAETAERLFDRGAFDLSLIHNADEGLTLIRVGEFMRHPEVAPLVAGFNKSVTDFQREWAKIDPRLTCAKLNGSPSARTPGIGNSLPRR